MKQMRLDAEARTATFYVCSCGGGNIRCMESSRLRMHPILMYRVLKAWTTGSVHAPELNGPPDASVTGVMVHRCNAKHEYQQQQNGRGLGASGRSSERAVEGIPEWDGAPPVR